MSHKINLKKILLVLSAISIIFAQSTALACKNRPITELVYMPKAELIEFACYSNSQMNSFKEMAKEVGDKSMAITKSNSSESVMLYMNRTIKYNNCAYAWKRNTDNALNVLSKDHGISRDGFYEKHCKSEGE